MSKALESASQAASPAILSAFVGFIRWASTYGHEIRESKRLLENGIVNSDFPVALELSAILSASINFGYDAKDQAVFMALDPEEFDWLPSLPIAEVVVGRDEVVLLTSPVEVDGEKFDAMAITVLTGQPKLWRAFPDAKSIGFMCLQHSESGFDVNLIAPERYPLRYLND